MTVRNGKALEPLTCPFTVLVDTREQRPFTFLGLHADARQGRRSLIVHTEAASLHAGDYGAVDEASGVAVPVAVERKSLGDLYGTLGQGRGRFVRELGRLAALAFAAVVVEADWATVLHAPPVHSRLNPKTIFRSVVAWQQRWPTVHWWFCPCRQFAEVVTFRMLERAWKVHAGKKSARPRAAIPRPS
jgi:ERCC4-type nuclease